MSGENGPIKILFVKSLRQDFSRLLFLLSGIFRSIYIRRSIMQSSLGSTAVVFVKVCPQIHCVRAS